VSLPLAISTSARPSSPGLSPISWTALVNSPTASFCGHPRRPMSTPMAISISLRDSKLSASLLAETSSVRRSSLVSDMLGRRGKCECGCGVRSLASGLAAINSSIAVTTAAGDSTWGKCPRPGSTASRLPGRGEWSPEVERMHGYEPGTVQPTTALVLSHKHPEDYEQVAATLDEIRRTGSRSALATASSTFKAEPAKL
jgi:hypothetical protein